MTSADIAIMILYLLGVTVIGLRTARKIESIGDYFMPRKFGKAMMIMHAFGTGTHSDQAVSVASKSFTNGLSGIWYQWLWLFATPFFWLIAPVMRRFRAITTADVFRARFDPGVAVLFAVVGMSQLAVSIGVILKGSGTIVQAGTGGVLSADAAIALMTVLFVVYGVAGGLSAAIITDFIQGILTVVFSFILLPPVLQAVGGLKGLHAQLGTTGRLSLVAPDDIGIFYIAVITINGLVGIVTQPHTMGNCAAGRTELEGRMGFMFGTMIKRICTVAWSLTGVAAVVYFGGRNIDPDHVFGLIAADFLPGIMSGALGLFLVALLASVMSSCDSFMVASAGLFTENIYKLFRPGKKDGHYIGIGRIASLGIVASGVLFAYRLEGVVAGLEIFWKISPMMGIVFWLGLFWRRMTVAGAWAATLGGFGVWFLTTRSVFIDLLKTLPGAGSLRFVVDSGGESAVYLPWQMVFYLAAGILLGVVVSLITRPVNEKQLDVFYSLIRTPIRAGEKVPAPCTLPEDAAVPESRNMFPGTGFEIPRPSRLSMAGFLTGWICVGAIILSVILIARG